MSLDAVVMRLVYTVVENIFLSLHTINTTKYHLAPHDYALLEFELISHLFHGFCIVLSRLPFESLLRGGSM